MICSVINLLSTVERCKSTFLLDEKFKLNGSTELSKIKNKSQGQGAHLSLLGGTFLVIQSFSAEIIIIIIANFSLFNRQYC